MKATIHSIFCHAPANAVYGIISNSVRWPDIFEPCINVESLEKSEGYEVIRVTAEVNGVEMQWVSHRVLLEEIYGINFETNPPMSLLQSMQGRWRVISMAEGGSLLSLEHNFQVKEEVSGLVDGVNTPDEAVDFMMQAIHRNSLKELNSIKKLAEQNN
ncbi:polyketide cyclase / dehydrase family protein [Cylindrospermum stagnale PCC 7417]|uniref:Polyketide cyclase / dehydrase family protein n=1 Tax=Cylindrospermum stagnale PCC 7417 TaxID=56107 RepID=K9WRI8_9NOST|nr:aromatase/cyclase [Cylindrospermum stagnale]AFZ22401.1 polyketide cyclase / dehydrase family protein [Cylindrospermum stagnale PCC 7417]